MKTKSKILTYVAAFLALIVTCLTLFSPIPATPKLIIRFALLIISASLLIVFKRSNHPRASLLSFTFFALNLAFLIVTPFTAGFWNLELNTSKGVALSKFSDAAIISFVLISSFLISRQNLRTIYLTKGRLIPGLVAGILFFILFGYLALNNPQQKPGPGFLAGNWIWILIFVFSNGFMEELIFRGIFLEKLNLLFKPFWSILMTSVCFAVPHLVVTYQPDLLLFGGITFVLGMICGYAMYLTRSIIAPALIHAGADLMIIIPIFTAYGVKS